MRAPGAPSDTRRRPADLAVPVACAHHIGETPRRIIDRHIQVLQDALAGYLNASIRDAQPVVEAYWLARLELRTWDTADALGLTLGEHDGRLRSLVADTGAACISLASQQTRVTHDLGQLVATIRVYAIRVALEATTVATDMERVDEA